MLSGQPPTLGAGSAGDCHPAAGWPGAWNIAVGDGSDIGIRRSGGGSSESSGAHFGAHAAAFGESRQCCARLPTCGSRRGRRARPRSACGEAGRECCHACGSGCQSRHSVSWHSRWDGSCNACGDGQSAQRRAIVLSMTLSTDERITNAHRAKLAYVYVRQSSPGTGPPSPGEH